jgi:hypothetical protein
MRATEQVRVAVYLHAPMRDVHGSNLGRVTTEKTFSWLCWFSSTSTHTARMSTWTMTTLYELLIHNLPTSFDTYATESFFYE